MKNSEQKILLLGEIPDRLLAFFKRHSFAVEVQTKPIDSNSISPDNFAFVISYRYRHILTEKIIRLFPNKIINLHISLLPWNRGADPNIWSFLEDTPKGISIHYIDKGIDTGDILVQKEFIFDNPATTLATSYDYLNTAIIDLLMDTWLNIYNRDIQPLRQIPGTGSYHVTKDKTKYGHLWSKKGWATPVTELIGKANHPPPA